MSHEVEQSQLAQVAFPRVWVREAIFRDDPNAQEPGPLQPEGERTAISLSVNIRLEERRAFVTLAGRVSDSSLTPRFELSAAVEGEFALSDSSDHAQLKDFADQQAPALLLPYLRQTFTQLTSLSRIGPLVLPPINMLSVVRAMRQRAEAGVNQEK